MSVDEQQLEQMARRLGVEAAERLDVDQTARVIVERLKNESERVVWWRRIPQLKVVAAVAVLVLAIGLLADNSGDSPSDADLSVLALPLELQALSDTELDEVFDSLSFKAPVSELVLASLEDMSVGELEQLLQTMMED